MVTTRGDPKLLDFGLARILRDDDSHDGEPPSPLTLSGAVFGIPGAMSPDQVLGKTVDARADVFAFGSLLYELATAKPAFVGTTVQETRDKVLHSESEPLARLRQDLPGDFIAIVDKALEFFASVISHDPDHASAFTGLATAFILSGIYGRPMDIVGPKARAAVDQALDWIETAHASHSGSLWSPCLRDWPGLRSHPQFRRIAEEMGFDPDGIRRGRGP